MSLHLSLFLTLFIQLSITCSWFPLLWISQIQPLPAALTNTAILCQMYFLLCGQYSSLLTRLLVSSLVVLHSALYTATQMIHLKHKSDLPLTVKPFHGFLDSV